MKRTLKQIGIFSFTLFICLFTMWLGGIELGDRGLTVAYWFAMSIGLSMSAVVIYSAGSDDE